MKINLVHQEGYLTVCIGKVEACHIRHITSDVKDCYSVSSRITGAELGVFQTEKMAMDAAREHIENEFMTLEWPDDDTTHTCPELATLLKAEVEIIKKHLDRHKWFLHITDEQLAAMDFAKKYGWIMKELYCLHACKKRSKCHHAMQLRDGGIEENPFGLEK
jgi:hypothetical protein